jgi:hypothetical protein
LRIFALLRLGAKSVFTETISFSRQAAKIRKVRAAITRLKHGRLKFTIVILMRTTKQSKKRFHLHHHFKTWLATGSILVLLFPTVPASSASSGPSQNPDQALPVFDINKTEHNFGEVFFGEDLAIAFTVRNLGAAPLQLAENPIVTGKPTIGLYREAWRGGKFSLKELLAPAGMRKGAAPYT